MIFLKFCIVAIVSYFSGLFGFAQIVGSLQTIKRRGLGISLFTIIVWLAILTAVWVLRVNFAPDQNIAYYAATLIALVQVLASGKIK